MRQILPSLLKTPPRGQKSSICESGKGDEGGTAQRGFSFAQLSFLEVKFSKTNSSHIDDFCPRRADSEEEGILIAAPQKVSARQRGKGSGDGPRYAADRDATFRRWPSMHRKSGRYPSWGDFREQGGKLVVKRASCALLFLLLLSNGKIVTRPFAGKGVPVGLLESENSVLVELANAKLSRIRCV